MDRDGTITPGLLPEIDYNEAELLCAEPVLPILFEPILRRERRRLRESEPARAPAWPAQIEDDAMAWLRLLLGKLTNEAVLEAFSAFRLLMNPLWRPREQPPGAAAPGAPTTVVEAFAHSAYGVEALSPDSGLEGLSALVEWACENWRSAVLEAIGRALDSGPLLGRTFAPGVGTLGALEHARFGLSDRHHGGRAAALLQYESGSLIYKPRSIAAEATWAAIYGYVIEGALGLRHKPPKLAILGDYGFTEVVQRTTCTTVEEVSRCYLRYGGILAVAHALGTTDLHHENIVVDGEYPAVVDAEALLPGRLAPIDRAHALLDGHLIGIETRSTVYELGILPIRVPAPLRRKGRNAGRVEFEIGSLSTCEDDFEALVPCGTGSDELALRRLRVRRKDYPNLPSLRGQVQKPSNFVPDIVEGFSRSYSFLLSHKDRVLRLLNGSTHPPRIRVVPRATVTYNALLGRSASIEVLGSRIQREGRLRRDLEELSSGRLDRAGALVDEEVHQLMRGDIPMFQTEIAGDCVASTPLEMSPLQAGQQRLASLDGRDHDLQRATIELSLARAWDERLAQSRGNGSCKIEHYVSALLDLVLSAAREGDGIIWWPYVTQQSNYAAARVHADTEALYDGTAGTAVVLAEAGSLLGREDWRALARRVFTPVIRAVAPLSLSRGIGLSRGLSGLAYAMGRTGRALDDAQLLDAGIRLLADHGRLLAAQEGYDDLMNGRAGLLIACLSLHATKPNPALLETADTAARALMDRAQSDEQGVFWPAPGGGAPGMHAAHGSTGIAVALARWASYRGTDECRNLVGKAFAWDDQYWSAEHNGWRHRARPDDPAAGWSWCLGRAGSISGRLMAKRLIDCEINEDMVSAALAAEAGGPLREPSTGLCCGTSGVLDAMVRLQQDFDSELVAGKIESAVAVLTGEAAVSKMHPLFCGLFTGCAGAAFALLRSTRPSELPSLVWFE